MRGHNRRQAVSRRRSYRLCASAPQPRRFKQCDGRLRIAALVNGRAVDRLVNSTSLRAAAPDLHRASCTAIGYAGSLSSQPRPCPTPWPPLMQSMLHVASLFLPGCLRSADAGTRARAFVDTAGMPESACPTPRARPRAPGNGRDACGSWATPWKSRRVCRLPGRAAGSDACPVIAARRRSRE
jgi:hypothetical protein